MPANKTPTASKKIILKIIMGLLAAILVSATVYISGIKHRYQAEIEMVRQKYNILREKDEIIDKLKSLRVDFFTKQSFLNYPSLSGYAMANFIRKLSLISPQHLYLLELNLKSEDQNITFFLKGNVYGASEKKCRQILAVFFRRLSAMDEVFQFFPGRPVPVEKKAGHIVFSAKGELEVE
jgi:hypothetical protein